MTSLSYFTNTKRVVVDENGCWNWQMSKSNTGYGQMRIAGKTHYAHRVSYELFTGPLIDGLVIDHLCMNKACVNPEHLEQVTQEINVQRAMCLTDFCRSGRHAWVAGATRCNECHSAHNTSRGKTPCSECGIPQTRQNMTRHMRRRHN